MAEKKFKDLRFGDKIYRAEVSYTSVGPMLFIGIYKITDNEAHRDFNVLALNKNTFVCVNPSLSEEKGLTTSIDTFFKMYKDAVLKARKIITDNKDGYDKINELATNDKEVRSVITSNKSIDIMMQLVKNK